MIFPSELGATLIVSDVCTACWDAGVWVHPAMRSTVASTRNPKRVNRVFIQPLLWYLRLFTGTPDNYSGSFQILEHVMKKGPV
jgi:hypothetical protein